MLQIVSERTSVRVGNALPILSKFRLHTYGRRLVPRLIFSKGRVDGGVVVPLHVDPNKALHVIYMK